MPSTISPQTDRDVERFELPNGAVLLVKEDPSSPVVSLNFWVEAGSIDEKPSERGMAHLIEHMIFKGTPTRGVGEISRQVEAAGGYLNAFTSYEHTCFYVVLPSSRLRTALEVEFDAYLHPLFDEGELAKEKEVVFEEMRMRRDDPWSWSWELLLKRLFTRNPYHWPVIGDEKVLRGVPRSALLRYYRTHYVPSRTVLVVVGDVDAERVHRWARRRFQEVPRRPAPRRSFLSDPEPRSLRLLQEEGDVQQTYVSLGFPTVPLSHPDSPALEILQAVLGDGNSCRLNLALRERDGSADEAGSDHFSGKYGGAFVFQALTDGKRLDRCLEGILVEVGRLVRTGPQPEELAKVKNRVKASKLYELQSVDGQAKNLGFWELQGGHSLEEKFLRELDGVTPQDLQRAADRYLRPERATLLLYHPKGVKSPGSAGRWQGLLERGLRKGTGKGTARRARGEPLRRYPLKDGSTLLVQERHGLPLGSLGLFLPGGFRGEGTAREGLTSLTAKCLLKGTRLHGHSEFSAEVEGLSAHLDTHMDKDFWGLTLDVPTLNLEKALDLMLETVLEPAFDPREVEKEKKLQITAIDRLKDDPGDWALLNSDLLTFAGTPYAHSPMGSAASVRRRTPGELRRWWERALRTPGRTWLAVGDFRARELAAILDGKLPRIRRGRMRTVPSASAVRPGELRLHNDARQTNLVLGLPAPVFGARDMPAFRLLHTALNGMGGRLFMDLRERRSLAYSVHGSHDAGSAAGIYQFSIGCAPAKESKARSGLLALLASVAADGVTAEEVKRAKTYLLGLHQVGQQSNRARLQGFARWELKGPGAEEMERFTRSIRKVTTAQVRDAARRYFGSGERTWVVLSPRKN